VSQLPRDRARRHRCGWNRTALHVRGVLLVRGRGRSYDVCHEYAKGCARDDEQTALPDDPPECFGCGRRGPFKFLGMLGARTMLRCEACGLDQTVTADGDVEVTQ
jgi:hypothetical protein